MLRSVIGSDRIGSGIGSDRGEDEFKDQPRLINFKFHKNPSHLEVSRTLLKNDGTLLGIGSGI